MPAARSPGYLDACQRDRPGVLTVTRSATWLVSLATIAGCGRFGFGDHVPLGDATAAPADTIDAGVPCVSANITDEFTDGMAAPLFASYAGNGLSISEANQQLVFTFATSVGAGQYAGYDTPTRYPLEGLCVVLHVIAAPSTVAIAYFKISTAASRQIEFFESTNLLVLRTHTGQAGSIVDNIVTLDFSLPSLAFWRLRNQAGTAYWDTSSDGVSFTQRAALPGFFTEPDVTIGLGAGAYYVVTNTPPVIFESISW
jgi:hypothetical protein